MTSRWISLLTFFIASASWAADEADSPWRFRANGSMSAADGNSDSLAYSFQLLAQYAGELHDAQFGLDHFYAEKGSVESSNSTKFHERLTRDIDEDWYIGQHGSVLTDELAELDYRIDTNIMLGRHLVSSDKASLSVELGPGYAWEQKASVNDQFMTARLAQRFEYRFNKELRLWQSFGWTPRVEDLSDGVFEAELGLENKLNGALSLRSFVRHRIDTSPAGGQGRSDTALMVGLGYGFGGIDEPESAGTDPGSPVSGNAAALNDGWESTAAMGLTLNRGNSDKTGLKLDWNSEFSDEQRELIWETGYHFADDAGQTSTDRLHARLQGNRQLEGPVFFGASFVFLRDDLADIDYRISPSILLGRRIIDTERTRLVVEAGPTMTIEQTGDASDRYPSVMVGERFKHRLNDKVSLKQSVVATSGFDQPERYTLSSRLALDTKLNSHLCWRVELESKYENLPVQGRDHHDLLLTSAVAWTF